MYDREYNCRALQLSIFEALKLSNYFFEVGIVIIIKSKLEFFGGREPRSIGQKALRNRRSIAIFAFARKSLLAIEFYQVLQTLCNCVESVLQRYGA